MKITVKTLITVVQALEETVAEAEKIRARAYTQGTIQALDEFVKKGKMLLENMMNEETYFYVEDALEFTKTNITEKEVVADGEV